MEKEYILSLHRVAKTFQGEDKKEVEVLKDITFDIRGGEFFVCIGPSGSGKSTLLRIMSGLEKTFWGKLELGNDIQPADISFVFQNFALLPWLTVFENVEIGLAARGIAFSGRKKIIERELVQLGLEKFARAYPKELSGGMRQRVGIARALVTNPKIIFMDEPFSELDSFTAEELRKEVLRIWAERKTTIVMVTHIIAEAIELADRIAILTARPGKIERIAANPLSRPRVLRSEEAYRLEDELSLLIKQKHIS